MHHQTLFVIDFGGQYSQLIVRRIRELGVFSELIPWQQANEALTNRRPDAVILSGGPRSVLEAGAPTLQPELIQGLPVLGICYGMQWVGHHLGGEVESAELREYGRRNLNSIRPGSVVDRMQNPQVWMSHGDQVVAPPPGSVITSSTDTCPVASFENLGEELICVQFHPEVSHTPGGQEILRTFLFEVAKLKGDWTGAQFIDEAILQIRSKVGERRVLCAVSGGVDSSVAAVLISKAIGPQLTCVFVDHGLMRKGEAEEVISTFRGLFGESFIPFDAKEQFLNALRKIRDPEEKRKVIGAEFVRAFELHADEIKGCDFLAQGTLYPDVVESGSSTAAKIKTHHNVGGLPDWMRLELLEPLKWLFKDEVREVGRVLGLPDWMVEREPFPGPGLAVRIIGEVTSENIVMVQEADWIWREEIRAQGFKDKVWQSYAALLDIKSVGVMGDERTYQHPIVLRAVASEDAMTATAVHFPPEFLDHVAHRIVNEVKGVNRVVYDLTSKPPATIEWE